MSRLYEPLHPAIIRAIRLVVRAGRHARIPVAVCGEMAADPVLLTLLVGLGLREFSMAPTAIPLAKRVIRGLRAADARVAAGARSAPAPRPRSKKAADATIEPNRRRRREAVVGCCLVWRM